ncbi:hypothetical protein [Mucilaginibacter kameinonensis]|uniref:hypothetical protein n=1 Tax=Mucilaginibacter kameinonensis TaxID=452286 RepID=UPI000EF7A5B1|nr:hypothetical protein [Mucilaginibacter kameinonensis]
MNTHKIAVSELAGYSKLLKRMSMDDRLNTTHIGLFSAVFVQWQRGGFKNPFSGTRKTLMAFSRIASIAMYHKCIKELDEYGYIRYEPSYHPKLGSQVYWPAGWEV